LPYWSIADRSRGRIGNLAKGQQAAERHRRVKLALNFWEDRQERQAQAAAAERTKEETARVGLPGIQRAETGSELLQTASETNISELSTRCTPTTEAGAGKW
jgi:hypothetical protein